VMCGGSILSCCPRNPHGHKRALKEEEYITKGTDHGRLRRGESKNLEKFGQV